MGRIGRGDDSWDLGPVGGPGGVDRDGSEALGGRGAERRPGDEEAARLAILVGRGHLAGLHHFGYLRPEWASLALTIEQHGWAGYERWAGWIRELHADDPDRCDRFIQAMEHAARDLSDEGDGPSA